MATQTELLFADLDMKAKRRYPDGASILVKTGVCDPLKVIRCKEAVKELGAIITLPDVFPTVAKPAVSDYEIEPTTGQVQRMNARQPTACPGASGNIVLSIPARSSDRDASAN